VTVKVKRIHAAQTKQDIEPHWQAVIDYSGLEVTIPIPARVLPGDSPYQHFEDAVDGLERLAHALLDFAALERSRLAKR
jgi:hypothetical protein